MPGGLSDLRKDALKGEQEQEDYQDYISEVQSDKLFGMSAVERMFVSIGCFLLTSLGGFLLLLVMDKIAL
ncbi:MAG: hypothetical protein K8S97_15690 [Anaerolineae bacterium]|nr:hypothetical protein [Anaerolineae bacterium]